MNALRISIHQKIPNHLSLKLQTKNPLPPFSPDSPLKNPTYPKHRDKPIIITTAHTPPPSPQKKAHAPAPLRGDPTPVAAVPGPLFRASFGN